MGDETKPEPSSSDMLAYLDIAVKFRNHEFNIQILRNAVFTGSHAVLLVSYAAIIADYPFAGFAIALFGILFSVFWLRYYRASVYWAWYWEQRCRMVNDSVCEKLGLEVNIFESHPAGASQKPPAFEYGGKQITYIPVHNVLRWTQILFFVLWIVLAVTGWWGLRSY